MIQLRPYQIDITAATRALMLGGSRSILIQAPTGSGKTALTAHMLGTAASKGMPSFFIVHRRELVKQSISTFGQVGIPVGVVSAGFEPDVRKLVQICSIQTLANRFASLQKPKLIVWDECHHVAAGSWMKVRAAFPNAYHVGLTATPQRLDGKGLGDHFQKMVEGPSVASLIEQGFLSPYRLFAPGGISTVGVHTKMGDFAKNEIAAAADKPTITGDAIKHYMKHAAGKRAVVFCVSIDHSKHVVAQFQAAGIPAEHVDGETDHDQRDAAIERFKAGKTLVLSNVELFGEGFDLPAIEAAILLRPTQSLGLYLQQVGRALRPAPGKAQAIILDHAGNCERHGLPDEERVWSLDGRAIKGRDKDSAGPPVKVCPKCFAAQFSGRPSCQVCGFVFDVVGRQIEHADGDLVEVDAAELSRRRFKENGRAQTKEDLIAIGRARKYKNPYAWAHHIMQARQRKKLEMGRVS